MAVPIGRSPAIDRHPGDQGVAAGHRLGVVIADGDPIARRALRDVFQANAGLVVVAEARDGIEATELALHYRPDVLVTELDLPRLDGLEAIRRVHATAPAIRIVVLAVRHTPEDQYAALRAGAAGYLPKTIRLETAVLALHGLVRGEAAVSRATTAQLVGRLRRAPDAGAGMRPVRSELTAREWEVLDRLCAGHDLKVVADQLGLAHATVISHLKHVMRKLGAHTREELLETANRLCRVPALA